jgi:four helix bundle protein
MGAKTYRELIAWQTADGFKRQVLTLVLAGAGAKNDWRYRDQLVSAATAVPADVMEGFLRCSAGDFARFLGFALGSLAEAEARLMDGIELGYFSAPECSEALRYARRATASISRLRRSQQHYAATRKGPASEAQRTRRT